MRGLAVSLSHFFVMSLPPLRKERTDMLDRTREDAVQRLAADIACFQPGSIPNRNPQEAKPPALGVATAAMLIRTD